MTTAEILGKYNFNHAAYMKISYELAAVPDLMMLELNTSETMVKKVLIKIVSGMTDLERAMAGIENIEELY